MNRLKKQMFVFSIAILMYNQEYVNNNIKTNKQERGVADKDLQVR